MDQHECLLMRSNLLIIDMLEHIEKDRPGLVPVNHTKFLRRTKRLMEIALDCHLPTAEEKKEIAGRNKD